MPQLKDKAVQALLLMIMYVFTTALVQFVGFLVSRLVHTQFPSTSVMTFLVLFLAAFGIAWPIAVFVTEWLIKRSGRKVEMLDAPRRPDARGADAPHAAIPIIGSGIPCAPTARHGAELCQHRAGYSAHQTLVMNQAQQAPP